MKLRIGIDLILVLLSVACGGCGTVRRSAPQPHVYTAREVFPLAAGQQWDMRDLNGYLTHFKVLAMSGERACQPGPFLGLHITKTNTNSYWWPGVPGAWGTWMFKYQSGSWNQPIIIGGDDALPLFTYQYGATKGYNMQATYYWFPPNLAVSEGQTQVLDTAYTSINHRGDDLSACMTERDNNFRMPTLNYWHVEASVQYVTTPIYSGPSVASKMCEGETKGQCATAGETAYFAPGIGLVETTIQGGDGPAGYKIVRIN